MLPLDSVIVVLFLLLSSTGLASAAVATERMPEFSVNNDELLDFASILYEADRNKASAGQVELNFQGHTGTRNNDDNADDPLFRRVDSSLLRRNDNFIALMNNYNRQTGVAEDETNAEKAETTAFLSAALESDVWQRLFNFLQEKNHPFAADAATFRKWIAQLWFVRYSRAKGKMDTSGFEHIFMGEVKNGEISGMHNWLRFYLLERDADQRFDYKGFLVQRFNVMAAVKFSWHDEWKRSGSFLIGTSPEFDMALYTLCFLSRRGRHTCDIEINGCPMSLTSHDLIQQGKVYIGSVYPSAGRMTTECRRLNSANRPGK